MNRLTTPFLAMLLAASSVPALAGGAEDVSAADVRVRAVPEGQPNSAAFMTLTNAGGADHAVVSAESPVANIVELHTHVNENGMMKMRRIERIDVPANGETMLQPGGLHVMLIDLKQGLTEGDEVPVTLVFEDDSRLELTAPVKKLQMKMKNHQHGGMGAATTD